MVFTSHPVCFRPVHWKSMSWHIARGVKQKPKYINVKNVQKLQHRVVSHDIWESKDSFIDFSYRFLLLIDFSKLLSKKIACQSAMTVIASLCAIKRPNLKSPVSKRKMCNVMWVGEWTLRNLLG